MIDLKIDEEALRHGIVSLYTHDNVEIDEELSDKILLKTHAMIWQLQRIVNL